MVAEAFRKQKKIKTEEFFFKLKNIHSLAWFDPFLASRSKHSRWNKNQKLAGGNQLHWKCEVAWSLGDEDRKEWRYWCDESKNSFRERPNWANQLEMQEAILGFGEWGKKKIVGGEGNPL